MNSPDSVEPSWRAFQGYDFAWKTTRKNGSRQTRLWR
ncbi:MAG: hypothetical protein U5L96_17120 [Owenweeksia sp.]|nr:hypothetical protein [Owenweeksia sp.]